MHPPLSIRLQYNIRQANTQVVPLPAQNLYRANPEIRQLHPPFLALIQQISHLGQTSILGGVIHQFQGLL
jgi:hypothetical protein